MEVSTMFVLQVQKNEKLVHLNNILEWESFYLFAFFL